MNKLNPLHRLLAALPVVAMFALSAPASAEAVKPAAKNLKPEETAILLVDFQANFVSPDGAWYPKFAEHYAKTRMLERTVELVGKARAKGVLSSGRDVRFIARPPPRSVRAAFPHTAPASGV